MGPYRNSSAKCLWEPEGDQRGTQGKGASGPGCFTKQTRKLLAEIAKGKGMLMTVSGTEGQMGYALEVAVGLLRLETKNFAGV